MSAFRRLPATLGLGILLSVLAIALMMIGGAPTSLAQPEPEPQDCVPSEGIQKVALFCISLEPETATNDVGTSHTVTATVTDDDAPVEGVEVAIIVDDGPHEGFFMVGTTDASGQVSLTYMGLEPGTDTIGACVVDPDDGGCSIFGSDEEPIILWDEATKEWVGEAVVALLTLEPETDTNAVGDDHTVVARVTVNGEPLEGLTALIVVADGPNGGESALGETDADGQLTLTYTGDDGLGTDTIVAVACLLPSETCEPLFTEGLAECLADLELCFADLQECVGESGGPIRCVLATKEWVEPTPTPTPTTASTPTPTPTVLAAVQTPTPTPVVLAAALPATGGEPSGGGSGVLPWLAAIAGVIAMMTAGGVWLAYQLRGVR